MKIMDDPEFRASHQSGTLVVEVSGLFGLSAVEPLRHEIFRWLVSADIQRVLIDFMHAVILLSDDDWQEITQRSLLPSAMRMKAALLVPETSGHQAWAHCERLNRAGHIRIAFTDPAQARRWAKLPKSKASAASGGRRSKRVP